MFKKTLLVTCCLAGVAGLPQLAAAQIGVPPTSLAPQQEFIKQAPSKQVKVTSKYIGPFANVGQALAADGIHLDLTMSDTFANTGAAGVDQWTTANLAKFRPDVDFNLGQMFHIPQLSDSHILFAYTFFLLRHNNYQYQTYVGNAPEGAVIGVHKPAYELSVLAFQQDINNDSTEIELGQTNPSYDFDPPVCGDGPACANTLAKFSWGMTPVDNGQLGAIVRQKLPDHFFVKAGMFETKPAPGYKTGINFLLAGSTGGTGIGQIGRTTTFVSAYMPGSYTIEGLYNSAKFTNGVTKIAHYGVAGVLFSGLQTVWRAGHAGPTQPMHHLDLWTKGAYTPDIDQSFRAEVDLGANFYGILPGRAYDRVGVRFNYYSLTNSGLYTEQTARVAAGGPKGLTNPNEFTYQLLTTFDIYRHATVTPDFMYLQDPDQYYASGKYPPHSGWQFTVTFRIPLGTILGLAT